MKNNFLTIRQFVFLCGKYPKKKEKKLAVLKNILIFAQRC
jgi:hypothetical protein